MEENHYYPFGLKHNVYSTGIKQKYELVENMENTARPAYVYQTDYQYKFQNQEYQDELGLNWYSFKWRNYDPAIGRFFNIDPLSEKYSYQSHYNFSENRVIDARELEGLEAYILFGSEERALENFGEQHNGASILEGREYGSNVYETVASDGNTYYQYDKPNEGSADGVQYPSVNKKLGERVSTVHSHGEYLKKHKNNEFSPADKKNAKKRGVDNNVVTPNGSLLNYDVGTGTVTETSTDMPSDPKDPDRKNKVNPVLNPKPVKTKPITPKNNGNSKIPDIGSAGPNNPKRLYPSGPVKWGY